MKYTTPEVELVMLVTEDVITASGSNPEPDLPGGEEF